MLVKLDNDRERMLSSLLDQLDLLWSLADDKALVTSEEAFEALRRRLLEVSGQIDRLMQNEKPKE
jgi:hypothetical protein